MRGPLGRFRATLLLWYAENRRDLPWRRSRDPYQIWVSEVMLQQTRVAAVLDHYQRFFLRFPSLIALAMSPVEDVLTAWSGLGYYRRARALHHAAQFVLHEHGGDLPQTAEALRKLPGIGAYTAAAVASIAFGEPVAVVDGNVDRVLTRLDGHPLRSVSAVQERAQQVLDVLNPADFNQAMMELGATLCTPRAPKCKQCPVYKWCRTRGEHPAPARARMLSRELAYALIEQKSRRSGDCVRLVQRPADSSLMPGMWELPGLALEDPLERPLLSLRHSITRTNYYVRVYPRQFEDDPALENKGARHEWINEGELASIPLTGLARKILLRLKRMDVQPLQEDDASLVSQDVHASQ